jgi:hypothetical protein
MEGIFMRNELIENITVELAKTLKAFTTDVVDEMVVHIQQFFSEEKIIIHGLTTEEKQKIIKKTFVKVHPDKDPSLENAANLIEALQCYKTRTLEQEQSPSHKLSVAPNRELFGTFASFESESYLRGLIGRHASIGQWVATKPKRMNPYLGFIARVLQPRGCDGNSLIYTRNRATILLRIMMLELLIELEGQSPEEVLSNQQQDSYPSNCKKDPLIWLYNEIILSYSSISLQNSYPHEERLSQPHLLNLLSTFIDYFDKYPSIEALDELISLDWPEESLHIKSLLEEMQTTFDKSADDLRKPKNAVRLMQGEPNPQLLIEDASSLHEQLMSFNILISECPLENIPNPYKSTSSIQVLEDFREDLLDCIAKIPSSFLGAVAKTKTGDYILGEGVVGHYLNEKLSEINRRINEERLSANFLLEEGTLQPYYQLPKVSIIHLCTLSGMMLQYRNYPQLMNSPTHYYETSCGFPESSRHYLGFIGQMEIPEIINPAVVNFLKECFKIYTIVPDYEGGFKVPLYAESKNLKHESVVLSVSNLFDNHFGQGMTLDGEQLKLFLLITNKYLAGDSVKFMQEPLKQVLKQHSTKEVWDGANGLSKLAEALVAHTIFSSETLGAQRLKKSTTEQAMTIDETRKRNDMCIAS